MSSLRIEPTMTIYGHALYTRWSDAGPAGRVSGCQVLYIVNSKVYNARSLKQGSKRFNSITKTIHFAHLVLLFIYAVCDQNCCF